MVVSTTGNRRQSAGNTNLGPHRARWAWCLVPLAGCLLGGCQMFDTLLKPRVELPPPHKEELVYQAGYVEEELAPLPGTLAGDFASTKVLFNRGLAKQLEGRRKEAAGDAAGARADLRQAEEDLYNAQRMFSWLYSQAERIKDTELAEASLFWQAEALYARGEWPDARRMYRKLLTEFPSSQYRAEAVKRQFDIANFWLQATRDEMAALDTPDAEAGWFRLPELDKRKPYYGLFGVEEQAIGTCQDIYVQDPTGPLGPQALFLAGGVNFYRERYQAADDYYSALVRDFPRSDLAPHALELAIQAKVNVTGGPEYDGRKLAEARELVDTALRQYPQLQEKQDFLQRTLWSINEQQAEKDFGIAEFYRRTNHPGAAYFYYELVRRRYHGTEWARKAEERLLELRDKVEQEVNR